MKRFLLPILLLFTLVAQGSSIFGTGGSGSGIAKYANFAALPVTCADGDVAVTIDTGIIYVCSGNVWSASAGPGVPLSVGTFDGQAVSANGSTIATSKLFEQSADATHPGLINTTTQTFGGTKTFANLKDSGLTASQLVATDSSKNLVSQATGNLTDAGTDGITIGTGTGAVVGSGTTISQHVGDSTHNGYLLSNDWVSFNGKQASGNYLTAITGDLAASGPGSAAGTLATVNSNVGSFTYGSFTVNGKGLITAASSGTAPVTSVALSVPATSIFGVTGSPVTTTGTLGLTTTGTSGGALYMSSTSQVASSALLAANQLVLGGGAGTAPFTLGSLGTTSQVYHGNAAGAGSFGSVVNADIANATIDVTTKITGVQPVANGGTAVSSVTTAPTATAFAGWDSNSNLSANSFIKGYATTATAAGTTTLTVASKQGQYFTGVTTQTVTMPVTSTLVLGQQYFLSNRSTGIVTVNSSGGNQIYLLPANTNILLTVILTTGTTAASWDYVFSNAGGGAYTPTVQRFTSGSGTYTTPANVNYIRVRMVGAGGGGAGSSTTAGANAGAGGAGSADTTFGSSLLAASKGSGGGANGAAGGAGGAATVTAGPIQIITLTGGQGSQGGITAVTSGATNGGNGGVSQFGGAGVGGNGGSGTAAQAAVANTGSGGGGASPGSAAQSYVGGGGGAGGYVEAIITSPAATYSYAIGTGGTAGTAGTSGAVGAAGGSGFIEVTEYYFNGAVGTATNVTGTVAIANGGTALTSLGAAGKVLRSDGSNLSYAYPVRTAKTSNYTLVANDDSVTGDTTGGAFTLTLPSAATVGDGKIYFITKIDSSANLLTVNTTSAQTIGSVTSTVLHRQWENLRVQSDGSNWIWLSDSQRSENAQLTCSATAAIVSQKGAWVSSIGNKSANVCTINFATGVFSSTPACFGSNKAGDPDANCTLITYTGTTSVTARPRNNTGTDTDATCDYLCNGPR